LNFTSDEYLLNIKNTNFVPVFVNQSQGAILKQIAETLCSGYYNFDNCASGDMVPYLAYDPTKKWSDIAKEFGDASRFRYSAINKEIHFQPYGDGDLGISFDGTLQESTMDPSNFTTQSAALQFVNDVTIVGAQEAGNNHEDHFIGDGFSGAFPLKHKVFGLASNEQGSGVLLVDKWSNTSLNTSNWTAEDPSNNFYYGANNSQSLNVLTPVVGPSSNPTSENTPGTSFILAQNGLELAGGVNIQHGEFVFNDVSEGRVGCIYDTEILNGFNQIAIQESSLEAGFQITPTASVVVTASGASGINIQPNRFGIIPSNAFTVVTKVNKSYLLNTIINAPAATRYTQVYRTIAGVAYGVVDPSTVQGSITWSVTETDLFTGVQTFYNFTLSNQTLPPTALYVLIDNNVLNCTVTSTQITAPLPGSLNVTCQIGSGPLAPIYISGNVQYTGAFVTPSGGNLPILPVNYGIAHGGVNPSNAFATYLTNTGTSILSTGKLPSGFGPEQSFALGSGLGQQAAELDSGQVTDTLNFYGDDLPGVGVRIRLQSFESQAAISRVQDAASIANEAAVVGDNGVRSLVVSNLSPLPRTSEDCDAAAQAYLQDSTTSRYQGNYNAAHIFFNQPDMNDIDFYPVCGRYLYVNVPALNINQQNMLVTAVTTTVTEMAGEIMTHAITFGVDKQISKLISKFVAINTNVLTSIDTSVAPDAQTLLNVGTNYLPDVQISSVSPFISGAMCTLQLNDPVPSGAMYEIRSDNATWGQRNQNHIAFVSTTGIYMLSRSAYDQTWYIRFVQPSTGGTVAPSGSYLSSRRSKAIRVVYPRVPTQPVLTYAGSDRLQYDFSGDVRNIEGISLSSGDGQGIFIQSIVGSEEDMNFDLEVLRGNTVFSVSGNLGVAQFELIPETERNFTAAFFNLMWEFSPSISVSIPVPLAPMVSVGYRFGPTVQLILTDISNPPRTDYKYTTMQLSRDAAFSVTGMIVSTQAASNPGVFVSTVPISGDVYGRAMFNDYISSGAWSNVVHVPQGDLIASDYLAGQGSVPPAITDANTSGGGLFSYLATSGTIMFISDGLSILWPNGRTDNILPMTGTYNQTLDIGPSGRALQPSGSYGFFPSVRAPQTSRAYMNFDGPYINYNTNTSSLTGQYSDGAVPMTNGPFVCQTASLAPSGSSTVPISGGGGGGTRGGNTCGVLESKLRLADGQITTLKNCRPGDIVKTRSGKNARIWQKEHRQDLTYLMRMASGKETRCALAHTLFASEWIPLLEILERTEEGEILYLDTPEGLDEVLSVCDPLTEWICRLHLMSLDPENAVDDDHVYELDGIWTHNVLLKDDPN
jgi:hypothetical protein